MSAVTASTLPAALLDLVLPRRCVGCGRPGAGLCRVCLAGTAPVVTAAGGLPVVAGAPYAGGVRAALLRYKERGRRDLAAPLAGLLVAAVAAFLRAHPGARPVLVAVPSDRASAAARGGDHVLRLARRAALRTGVPLVPGVLRQVRAKQDSAGLGIAERAGNLAGAFAARAGPDAAAAGALLVDDIVTTGATLGEGARALRAAGWPVLGAVTVAATPSGRDRPSVSSTRNS